MPKQRKFDSGASRNSDDGKHDIDGFTCPLNEDSFYAYMHKHRQLEDGSLRPADNWKLGIPPEQLMKSLRRHRHEVDMIIAGFSDGDIIEALNAERFNSEALKRHYLLELKHFDE